MRSSKSSGLLHAALMAVSMQGFNGQSPLLRHAGNASWFRPNSPRRDTSLMREIADHNAAVDAKKRARRDRRLKRQGREGE